MTDLVERIAQAIYESQFADQWRGGFGIEADLFRQSARAALKSLEDWIEADLSALNSAADAMQSIGNQSELDDICEQITRIKLVRTRIFGAAE